MVRIPLNTDNTDPVHLTIPMRVVSPCPPIATKGPPLSPWQPSFPGVEIKILKIKFEEKKIKTNLEIVFLPPLVFCSTPIYGRSSNLINWRQNYK